jgi:hypothetical protein
VWTLPGLFMRTGPYPDFYFALLVSCPNGS